MSLPRKVVRLAMVQYPSEAIHPLLDGNGRGGRLPISPQLVRWGLLPQPVLCVSAFLFRHREDRDELVMAVSERSSWGEWISSFLQGAAEQSEGAVAGTRRLERPSRLRQPRATRRDGARSPLGEGFPCWFWQRLILWCQSTRR
jgi:Fic family protein